MTVVRDPSLGMESSQSTLCEETIPFMAPEFLAPPGPGLGGSTPSKEADIYALAMVIYQVRTARRIVPGLTNSSRVGAHWNTTFSSTAPVRGGDPGPDGRETIKTDECTRYRPLRRGMEIIGRLLENRAYASASSEGCLGPCQSGFIGLRYTSFSWGYTPKGRRL